MKLRLSIVLAAFWVAVCIDVPQYEIDVMADIVASPQEWVQGAWDGKVSNSESVIIQKEINRAVKDKRAVDFSDEDQIIKDRFATPGYKTRKKRGKADDTW